MLRSINPLNCNICLRGHPSPLAFSDKFLHWNLSSLVIPEAVILKTYVAIDAKGVIVTKSMVWNYFLSKWLRLKGRHVHCYQCAVLLCVDVKAERGNQMWAMWTGQPQIQTASYLQEISGREIINVECRCHLVVTLWQIVVFYILF